MAGGSLPAILNAANEVAVDAFVRGELSFVGISEVVEKVMTKLAGSEGKTLEEILAADSEARVCAKSFLS